MDGKLMRTPIAPVRNQDGAYAVPEEIRVRALKVVRKHAPEDAEFLIDVLGIGDPEGEA